MARIFTHWAAAEVYFQNSWPPSAPPQKGAQPAQPGYLQKEKTFISTGRGPGRHFFSAQHPPGARISSGRRTRGKENLGRAENNRALQVAFAGFAG